VNAVTKPTQQTSAGGIVFRTGADGIQVALIARSRSRRGKAPPSSPPHADTVWALPKGWVEPGETIPGAALREIREETGLTGRILEPLGQIAYSFYSVEDKRKIQKTVHFYLVEYISGETSDHDHEVDEARWWPLDGALAQMTYQSEREMMIKAKARLTDASSESPRP